tara:strand:+ start:4275 stop:5480 length:1206 start_codon:yes stop_codon:yes gene_type:complete
MAGNDANSKDLFSERNRYKFFSGVHTSSPELLFDASEDTTYGKKTPSGESILFNRAAGILSPANTQGTLATINNLDGVEALDFVATAFIEMRDSLEVKFQRSPLSEASAYREAIPTAGWKDYATLYREYLDQVYDKFVSEYFAKPGMGNKIVDVTSFVEEFNVFIGMVAKQVPFILSSFVGSHICPPHVSGLVIDLSTDDCGNDTLKMEKYLKDINYSSFVKHCAAYGFRLDKNVPWRIHADVNSEHMKLKMAEKQISNVGEFYNFYFNRTEAEDFLSVIEAYTYIYSKLVSDFPTYTKKIVCDKKVVSKVHERQKVETFGRSDVVFGEGVRGYPYWLRVYIYLKINENKLSYSQTQMDTLVKNAVSMNSYLDIFKALVYTNEVLREAEVIPVSLMETLRV